MTPEEVLRRFFKDTLYNLEYSFEHGYDHAIAVARHALEAVKRETATGNLDSTRGELVILAAYFHDLDDPKLFKTENYANARAALRDLNVPASNAELVIDMIKLVSCSSGITEEPEQRWMVIPRDCDRLEAIGRVGIIRCKIFSERRGIPAMTPNTPRPRTTQDIIAAATQARFDAYRNGKKSESQLDHYYDKLLHIGLPENLHSKNPYILLEAGHRYREMIEYLLNVVY